MCKLLQEDLQYISRLKSIADKIFKAILRKYLTHIEKVSKDK